MQSLFTCFDVNIVIQSFLPVLPSISLYNLFYLFSRQCSYSIIVYLFSREYRYLYGCRYGYLAINMFVIWLRMCNYVDVMSVSRWNTLIMSDNKCKVVIII